jgi:ribosomal protein S18 acetylase RimI-like enzyme
MKIRTATSADIAYLTDLWHERAMLLGQSDLRFSDLQHQRTGWIQKVTSRIISPNCALYVAEVETGLAGYITGCTRTSHYGVIDEIALDTHVYHAGAGRALWSAARDWFHGQNVERILISVPRYHTVEQAFWRALGAVEWKDETWITPPELVWMTL